MRRAERTLLWAAAALLLSGCGSAPPAPSPPQQAATSATQQAARAWARGDVAQARLLYERALAAADSVEDFPLAGATLINLALVHARGGDLAAAHQRLERVLAAPQRYGATLNAAAATRKAMLYLDAPDLDAATTWAERASTACANPCEHGATLAVLRAHVAWQRGDAGASARHAEQGLALATQAKLPAEQANALRLLGRARGSVGQHAQAAVDLGQALAIDQRLGLPDRVALDLVFAGDVELLRQQPAAAREFFERALVVYQASGATKAADALRVRLAELNRR